MNSSLVIYDNYLRNSSTAKSPRASLYSRLALASAALYFRYSELLMPYLNAFLLLTFFPASLFALLLDSNAAHP